MDKYFSELKPSVAKAVERLIECFDFESVAKHMSATGWTYAGIGVPSVEYMRDRQREELARVVSICLRDGVNVSSSLGGFEVSAQIGFGDIEISIKFIIDSAEAFIPYDNSTGGSGKLSR